MASQVLYLGQYGWVLGFIFWQNNVLRKLWNFLDNTGVIDGLTNNVDAILDIDKQLCLGIFECKVSLSIEKLGSFFLRYYQTSKSRNLWRISSNISKFKYSATQLIVLPHLNSSAWEGGGRTDIDPTLAINWLCCLSDPRPTIVLWLLQQNNVRLSIKQDASLRISTTFNQLTCATNWARWRRRLSDDR